ncbi:hypothetical protein [Actinomadura sp. NPDC048394]|uniref:hypothetical protein n=1 Tax=Actinomadura sp. NPDC048394 TaxID=3158223 RepID=UPI0033DE5020
MSTHWLYQWIDEFSVRDAEDARNKFALPGPASRLHQLASEAPRWTDGALPDGRAIVAGSTMDFSGRLSCFHSECLGKQVDRLFGSVWHYFDSVVVEGPVADSYIEGFEEEPSKRKVPFEWKVSQDVQFLLNLRSSGVSEYLSFRAKAHHFCEAHIQQHAEEAGVLHFFDPSLRADIAKQIKNESNIELQPEGKGWRFTVRHPNMPEPFNGFAQPKKKAKKDKRRKNEMPTKQQIAEFVVKKSAYALICDIATSKFTSLPLAIETLHLRPAWRAADGRMRESSIALEIPLPIMQGMSVRDACLLRQDLRPHFERFQHALTIAIREQLARDPGQEDSRIAQAVANEYIKPSLAEIDRALKESKRSLSVKVGSSLAVGAAVASTGLILSVPLVVASGLAAVGVSVPGIHKFFDENREVRTSDVYFLWKAANRKR